MTTSLSSRPFDAYSHAEGWCLVIPPSKHFPAEPPIVIDGPYINKDAAEKCLAIVYHNTPSIKLKYQAFRPTQSTISSLNQQVIHNSINDLK